jgi:hypothetical protein
MKKALISPNESPIQYIESWYNNSPVYATYPNSCRVAEICETEFEIAPPLFWVDCSDDIIADQFYYDTATNEIYPIVNAPIPVAI